MALACLLARCTRGSVHAQAADSLEEAIELHRGFKQAHETWTKIGKVCSCMTFTRNRHEMQAYLEFDQACTALRDFPRCRLLAAHSIRRY